MTDVRTPPANAPRTWDFLLTVVFIVLQVILLVVLVLAAFSFGAINSGCQTTETGCNVGVVSFGQQLCTWGPIVIAGITVPIAIFRVLRRRIAFWVSLLGGVLMVAVFLLGGVIMTSGYPSI